MKSVKVRLSILSVLLVLVIGMLAAVTVNASEDEKDYVIADNVSIGSVSVGGMTAEEAEAAVENHVKEYTGAEFTMTGVSDKSVTVSGAELGLTWGNTQVVEEALTLGKSGNLLTRYKNKKDLETNGKQFPLIFTVDDELTSEYLSNNSAKLSQEAQNNGLIRENGAFTVVEGHEGIEINVDGSLQNIKDFLADGWDGSDAEIALATDVTEPIGTTEELEKVQDVLGSFNTDFSTSSDARIANIEHAVSFIDGTVLYPGEEFSVYDKIAPLDGSNGYELAGAYENGTTVESYGGGVCQVSTTLYNAVLYSELEVTQRSNHSMMVSYVDPSRDAAIAAAGDCKIVNPSLNCVYNKGVTVPISVCCLLI